MKNQLFSLLVLSMLFVSFKANSQVLTPKQTESIKKEVDAEFSLMLDFAEKLDYDKLNAGVDDSREAGFITNNKYYPLFATLIAEMQSNARGIDHQDITIGEKKYTVLSDRIVLLTVAGSADATLTDGRVIPASFYWSFVYEKTGGAWKVIHSHQTTVR